ncbi:5,6-dimethylbenzimidazole synthase [Ochrobactrum sp. CM-21-5]|nr:5,6-dimethylbenzimidazole synthase [Ochrobactrum sp. CM-21-5]MBC2884312.1 5,6-dimethylbenzimidazole synthase [Ochrobactrum sp. CM-21-5]
MKFSPTDQDALFSILRWRRDTRHFQTAPVPDKWLEKLHEAMEYAPSVGNSRPWRIFEVQSAEKREAVHCIFETSNRQAARVYDQARASEYKKLKLEAIQTAPVQLAIFTETDPVEGHGLGRQTMASTLEQSTAMAVQNLNLAARSLGLGVGMVSILEPDAMKQLFQVPMDWRFSFYLCIGWPCFNSDMPLLHENGWQENTIRRWKKI